MKVLKMFFSLMAIAFFNSCNQENIITQQNEETVTSLEKYPQQVINISTTNDSLTNYLYRTKHTNCDTRMVSLLNDSVWSSGKGHTLIYENDEIASADDNLQRYVYLGSILKGGSLENMRYEPISKQTDPITISYSFPAKFVVSEIARPSLSAMRQSISNTMRNNNMTGQQLVSFDYDMTQIYCYDELKLAFGSNINIAKIVNVSTDITAHKIKSKSSLFARVIQKNFTVDMDIPMDGNLLLKDNELQSIDNYSPIYISSITYGRLGIIYIESQSSYSELSAAVKVALNTKIVNGDFNIEAKYQQILKEAHIRISIIGGNGQYTCETVEGFPKFIEFITKGGVYSPEVPGIPIFFTASYLSDNSPYYTKFKVNIANE